MCGCGKPFVPPYLKAPPKKININVKNINANGTNLTVFYVKKGKRNVVIGVKKA